MLHIEFANISNFAVSDEFLKKASGRYYTGEPVGRRLAQDVVANYRKIGFSEKAIKVIDPFGGDARLIEWLIEEWINQLGLSVKWIVEIWDISDSGFQEAELRINRLIEKGISIECSYCVGDAFGLQKERAAFDIVITNPPWELLKPDRREIEALHPDARDAYVEKMRKYDEWLSACYQLSQPKRKFAGWGTNLSRVGLELSLLLARPRGFVGVVMPASLMADDQSVKLRKHLFAENGVCDITYFPAEAKLYGSADVASITLVVEAHGNFKESLTISTYVNEAECVEKTDLKLNLHALDSSDYVLPVAFGASAVGLLEKIKSKFQTWVDLERDSDTGFWAGREVDETGSQQWLAEISLYPDFPFLKGRMIERYAVREYPSQGVVKKNWIPPQSVRYERIAWRDVSRPNQKRRVIATLVPSGWVLGNSLGVASFSGQRRGAIRSLLGIMNSAVFEFMLRTHLATGHVSLTSLRKVSIPSISFLDQESELQNLVQVILDGDMKVEPMVDAYVAQRVYGLTLDEYGLILRLFPKFDQEEIKIKENAFNDLQKKFMPVSVDHGTKANSLDGYDSGSQKVIFNHISAKLSDLDMRMVRALPEGGNWKDIPESIPSKRLEQIRESYARGEGSRSTYYGRLRRDKPSYTINTYFNRPGNGCHVHPIQDRVISQREAARLQSFPDDFEFLGPQGAICNQIGNAVPPLLAYRIAKTLGKPGSYVDLFSGAGGMGLGFKWAGWKPIVANDIEPKFLATYMRNVHSRSIAGSITEASVFEELVAVAKNGRRQDEPFWVLGGPPCQGFSTAGSRRSMDDPRNHLFWDYVRFLEEVRPDGFVFENVTGLLSIEGGKVFESVKKAFSSVMPEIYGAVLSAHEHGVPQRRKRVILVGFHDKSAAPWIPPNSITSLHEFQTELFDGVQRAISVEEALWDLPPLEAGEDGSRKPFSNTPQTIYQALMRGKINPETYFDLLSRGDRVWGK